MMRKPPTSAAADRDLCCGRICSTMATRKMVRLRGLALWSCSCQRYVQGSDGGENGRGERYEHEEGSGED